MAFNKLRVEQLQLGIIDDTHIAAGAAISESKLSIDWATHTHDILASRLLIDNVQVNAIAVAQNAPSITVTAQVSAPAATADNVLGAVVQDGKNQVIIRDSVSGDPVIGGSANKEIYGKLTNNGTDFIVTFFTKDGTGAEIAVNMPAATTIDFQFPQRFDLTTISEAFAVREKFVDGASDVSARLDLTQIARDVYGGSYAYGHDGNATQAKTLVQTLTDETHGTTNTGVAAKDVIDEVVAGRSTYTDLNSRLNAIDTKAGQAHIAFYAEDKQVLAGDPLIGTSIYTLQNATPFTVGNHSLSVHINGGLQMVGVHYTEGADGKSVNFAPELIAQNDIIQLRWYV